MIKKRSVSKSNTFSTALKISFPIAFAHVPLGLVFGLLFENQGFNDVLGPVMSLLVYSGSAQFLALSVMDAAGPLSELLLACFLVALRNSFYGPALFQRFRPFSFWQQVYLIFGLVDSTYALLLYPSPVSKKEDARYCLYLTGLIHFYWVFGTLLGVLLGSVLPTIHGLEFILTLLFAILALEQYLKIRQGWPFLVAAVCWGVFSVVIPPYALLLSIVTSSIIFSCVIAQEKSPA